MPRLPRQVADLLRRELGSIEALETLILLARAPDRAFTAAAVAEDLGGTAHAALRSLEGLCARGFLDVRTASDVVFSWKPSNQTIAKTAQTMIDAYRSSRLEVLELLSGARAARDFADAFRIKPEDEGEDDDR